MKLKKIVTVHLVEATLIEGAASHFSGRVWAERIAKFSHNEKGGRWILQTVLLSRKCKLRWKLNSELDFQKGTAISSLTEVSGFCKNLSALKIRLELTNKCDNLHLEWANIK